jgi:hypothetical protein
MRGVRFLGVTVIAIGLVATRPGTARAQAIDATAILTQAREALGGDARIAKVNTFIVTGRTRQVRGESLVPIEFEIQVQLPDRYSRHDEFPAQDAGPQTSGFSGDDLIQIPRPPPPPARPGGPAPPSPEQQAAAQRARVIAVKQDFARLMLGLFATSSSAYPLTFTYAGQAEAPQGKAYVLDAKGPANFTARLFIDAATHVPLMVSWQQAAPPARRGGPPPPGPPPQSPPPQGAPPAVEHRLYFADYRDVDGLRLPFRIRHAVAADTTEETTFDRFRINARVDVKRFDTTN